ncbi:hypothetical protein D9611_007753 [Ephemerocybe angulata]|uniref:Uncharacterized protein n=1 Tax=Ephemerocybe angulata TaxID=980116 RepID=A0A8H5FC36_9AGAR|nr:hypothetical protein D9611_007753 [Tulosesus angulatus]
MPALDILRALINPGRFQPAQGPQKKLRKRSTLRKGKAESLTSSSTEHDHGYREHHPDPRTRAPSTLAYDAGNPKLSTSIHRKASTVREQQRHDYDGPHAPSLYHDPRHQPPPHAPAPVYPLETQYYEYHDPGPSPLETSANQSGHYYPQADISGDYSGSWQPHQSTYDTPSALSPVSEHRAQYFIEPSEAGEDWSPIPDVHRQSTSSESMHGTFGLGTRPSSRNAGYDSAVSVGQWTNKAEYDQSAVYEFYEEDPDVSRPVSSYYPPSAPLNSRPMPTMPMSSTPPLAPQAPHPHPGLGHNDLGLHMPPPAARSAISHNYEETHDEARQLPALSIPQSYSSSPPSRVPSSIHQQAPPPSLHGSAYQGNTRAGNPRDKGTGNHPPTREYDHHHSRARSNTQERRRGSVDQPRARSSSRDKGKQREEYPNSRYHESNHEQPLQPKRPEPKEQQKRPFSPENINPDILDRDYGSDDEVYQYIVPLGVDVIFRDASGNEITRVGEFPAEPPPPPQSKEARSAPMVVVDEHGREIYRSVNFVCGVDHTKRDGASGISEAQINGDSNTMAISFTTKGVLVITPCKDLVQSEATLQKHRQRKHF